MKYSEQARELLGGGIIVGSKKDQLLTICPKCRKKKFYFGLDSGRSQCKSVACGIKYASIYSLGKFIRDIAYKPYLLAMSKTSGDIDPWAGETEEALPAWEVPKAKCYLIHRNVGKELCESANIWAMQKSGTLIFPLHNFFSGGTTPYYRFLGGQLRWIGESGFERIHHCYGGADVLSKGYKSCILVEGIFDVLTTGLSGVAIATLGAEYSLFLMAFLSNHFEKIYHLPDNDEAGKASVRKLSKLCKAYGLPYTEIGSGLYGRYQEAKDPADLTMVSGKQLNLYRRCVTGEI